MKAGTDGMVEIFDIPDNKVRRVFPVDAREMIKLGTAKLPDTETPKPKAAEKPPEPYDFNRHTVPELKNFADEAEIDGFEEMTKAKLVEALTKIGFQPKPKAA